MKVRNRAAFEVDLCGRKHQIETAETVIDAVKVDIVCENPQCNLVLDNDKIHYKFKVKNQSHVNLHNTKFRDFLCEHSRYVEGSLTINGRPHKACVRDRVLEVEIRELRACGTCMIEFDIRAHSFQSECGLGVGDNGDNGDFDDDNGDDNDNDCDCRRRNFVNGNQVL